MQLSKNFTLSELTYSYTAEQKGIDNKPNDEQIKNLKYLAENVLQPIRDYFGVPISVSSGFRSKSLNRVIDGSPTSHHSHGCAADIDFTDKSTGYTLIDIFNYITDNLEYTELILEEPKDGWIHIAIAKGRKFEKVNKLKRWKGDSVREMNKEDINDYWRSLK